MAREDDIPFSFLGFKPLGESGKSRAVLVGLSCVLAAAVARLLLEQVFAGIAPFILTFPVVILATLIAGRVAGWITIVGCQALTVLFVLPHWIRLNGDRPEQIVNLVLSTVSLALIVWAISAWRRLSSLHHAQCEREVRTLSLLISEMDHRTKNNFQIAASMLTSQAATAGEHSAKEDLDLAASRLISIAEVYNHLSGDAEPGGAVSLKRHVAQICEAIECSILPPTIALSVSGDDCRADTETALPVGLLVNEWVSNAIKYAFPTGEGHITVTLSCSEKRIHVEVRDDGVGIAPAAKRGVGGALMASLIAALNGSSSIENDHGTRCTVSFPRRDHR